LIASWYEPAEQVKNVKLMSGREHFLTSSCIAVEVEKRGVTSGSFCVLFYANQPTINVSPHTYIEIRFINLENPYAKLSEGVPYNKSFVNVPLMFCHNLSY
jgi:hypothetical protein